MEPEITIDQWKVVMQAKLDTFVDCIDKSELQKAEDWTMLFVDHIESV